ncbi:MAG: LCP family protein [Angustibacter sp.]
MRHRAQSASQDSGRLALRNRPRGRHVSSRGEGFGRFAGVTLSSLVPGAGLVAVGRRRFGAILLALTAVVAAVGIAVLVSGGLLDRLIDLAVSRNRLLVLAVGLALVGTVWCLTVLFSAWRARPERPTRLQSVLGLSLVALVCTTIAAPSAVGARYALITRDLVGNVLSDESTGVDGAARPGSDGDPWKDVPRVNLLLIGSDAGADRTGVRTDSMIVASIDTRTGNTLLIGLPRSLQNAPFPESNPLYQVWPNGYNCGDACLLNAVWEEAATTHQALFPGDSNPGLTTLRDVVGEITGLRIDNYSIIDLKGFTELVDAMGGVQVNVQQRVPIGDKNAPSNFIEPGQQKLTGYQALWFSRSRSGTDDYDRMLRQRCMVGNLVDQVNPVTLLRRFPALASVLENNVSTDVSTDALKAWVILVQRMQQGRITSLPLTGTVINTVVPDFEAIRSYIQQAVAPQPASTAGPTNPSGGPATSSTAPGASRSPSDPAAAPPTSSSPTGGGSGPGNATDSTQAQDVDAVC